MAGGPAAGDIDVRDYVRIKVLTMGDGGTGKSCLIKRYCEQKFVTRYISTIGVDFGVRSIKIDNVTVKVNFWDLSGHPEFFEVRNEFYKDSQAVILVYDVTSRNSFSAIDDWHKECQKFGGGSCFIKILCANKVDAADKKRAVSPADGQKWAESKGYAYIETSAKSGQNVNEMFEHAFSEVVSQMNVAKVQP